MAVSEGKFITIYVLILELHIISMSEKCMDDENALYLEGNCYKIVKQWMNYYNAKNFCAASENTLAVIETADHAAGLMKMFLTLWKVTPMLYNFWVGFPTSNRLEFYKQQYDQIKDIKDTSVNVLKTEISNFTSGGCIGLQWHPTYPNAYTLVSYTDPEHCTNNCCWFICQEEDIFSGSSRQAICTAVIFGSMMLILFFMLKINQ